MPDARLSTTQNATSNNAGKDPAQYSFLQKVYFLITILFLMTGSTVTRDGKKGHMVRVAANVRFVPAEYKGTDPRTKAAHKEKR